MSENNKALWLFIGLTLFLFFMGWAFNDRGTRNGD